ncbi:MAG: stalk domain-containing protein [Caldisericia bacterium]
MKKSATTILIIMMVLIMSSSGNKVIFSSSETSNKWTETKVEDYPEVTTSDDTSEDFELKLWEPERFEGSGELEQKWTSEIEYVHDFDHHYFNNTPEGWLYISATKEPNDLGEIGPEATDVAVYGENYKNILFDSVTGEAKQFPPKFSLFSHLQTNYKLCDPPHGYNKEEPLIYRCYDIENNKIIWQINDTREIQVMVKYFLPIQVVDGKFFIITNGVSFIDSKTGEIKWSYDLDESYGLFHNPFIINTISVGKYVFMIDMCRENAKRNPRRDLTRLNELYRIDTESGEIVECDVEHFLSDRFLYDEAHLLMHKVSYIFEYNTDKQNKDFNIIYIKDSIEKKYPKLNCTMIENLGYCKPINKITPFSFCIESLYYNIYSPDLSSGIVLMKPFYEFDTHQFLLNRDSFELQYIDPGIIGSTKSYMQVIDDELIIQTLEEIMCLDIETFEKKWTIDKSNLKHPDKSEVLAVDYRGVFVRDDDDTGTARFYCYGMPEPEPTPEPIPEPIPEPTPDPTPEPIPEPVPEPTPDPEPEPTPEPEPALIIESLLKFQIAEEYYVLDGIKRDIDAAPVIQNGRTLLPARYVTEPLGGDVGWEASEKKVVCTLGETIVEFWIGKPIAKINGEEVQIDPDNPDVVPTIINDRTMVPMRFLAESLGCEVEWVSETKEIILTCTP